MSLVTDTRRNISSFSFTAITNSAIDTIDWKLIFSFSFSAATGRFTATPACPHPRNPRSALHPQAWLLLRVRPPTHPNKKLKSVRKPGVWKCPSVSGWIGYYPIGIDFGYRSPEESNRLTAQPIRKQRIIQSTNHGAGSQTAPPSFPNLLHLR